MLKVIRIQREAKKGQDARFTCFPKNQILHFQTLDFASQPCV